MSDDMTISAVRIRISACAFPTCEEVHFSRDGVLHRMVLIPPQPPTIDDALALLAAFDDLRTERDRLARILAVERGDESQAPEGWEWNQHARHWFRRDCGDVLYRDTGTGWWHRMSAGAVSASHHGLALEAMEAADKARGARHD